MISRKGLVASVGVLVVLCFGLVMAARANNGEERIYAKRGNRDMHLYVFRPKPEKALHMGILLIHGGGWVEGSAADMGDLGRGLADLGFLAASVEYRLAPHDRWPAQLDDCQEAVRYLRSHSSDLGIGEKVGAIGGSAGGHLAICLGSMGDRDVRVQAVGDYFGPCDLRKPFPAALDGLWEKLYGKPQAQALAEREAMSPILHIDRATSPMFIIHGKSDELVPYEQAVILTDKLKANGVDVDCRLIDGMTHGIDISKPDQLKAFLDLVAWMKLKLK